MDFPWCPNLLSLTQGPKRACILATLERSTVYKNKSCYTGELASPDAPPRVCSLALCSDPGSAHDSLCDPRASSQITPWFHPTALFHLHTPCFLLRDSCVSTVPICSTLPWWGVPHACAHSLLPLRSWKPPALGTGGGARCIVPKCTWFRVCLLAPRTISIYDRSSASMCWRKEWRSRILKWLVSGT